MRFGLSRLTRHLAQSVGLTPPVLSRNPLWPGTSKARLPRWAPSAWRAASLPLRPLADLRRCVPSVALGQADREQRDAPINWRSPTETSRIQQRRLYPTCQVSRVTGAQRLPAGLGSVALGVEA